MKTPRELHIRELLLEFYISYSAIKRCEVLQFLNIIYKTLVVQFFITNTSFGITYCRFFQICQNDTISPLTPKKMKKKKGRWVRNISCRGWMDGWA